MDGCLLSAHTGLLGPARLRGGTDAAGGHRGRLLVHDSPVQSARCRHALRLQPDRRGIVQTPGRIEPSIFGSGGETIKSLF